MAFLFTDLFFLTTISIGLLGNVGLFVAYWKGYRRDPRLDEAIVIFFATGGIIAGGKVCWLTFDPAIVELIGDSRYYMFIGGVALIWTSVDSVIKTIKAGSKRPHGNA